MQDQLVGKSLQALRKKRGMTQAELGVEIGVTGSAVGQWEQRKTTPSWQQLQKLARFFDIDDGAATPDEMTQIINTLDQGVSLMEEMGRHLDYHGSVLQALAERLGVEVGPPPTPISPPTR